VWQSSARSNPLISSLILMPSRIAHTQVVLCHVTKTAAWRQQRFTSPTHRPRFERQRRRALIRDVARRCPCKSQLLFYIPPCTTAVLRAGSIVYGRLTVAVEMHLRAEMRLAAKRLRRSPLSVSMTLLSVKLLHIIKTVTSTPVAEIELTPMTSWREDYRYLNPINSVKALKEGG